MTRLGERLFLSYRSDDIVRAEALARHLADEGWFGTVSLVPPEKLARRREILLVYDYFELMEFIVDTIVACDSFGFLDREDHWSSYWTQQELTQWRRFAKKHEIYGIGDEGVTTYGVDPMDADEKRLLARLSIGTKRNQPHLGPPSYWGKFAKSCFLVQCNSCGRNLVVTQKAVYATLRGTLDARCAWCHSPLRFTELPEKGNFYRKRILLDGSPGATQPALSTFDLQTLLVMNELPESVRVVKKPGEQLLSDAETVGNVFTLGLYGKIKKAIKGND